MKKIDWSTVFILMLALVLRLYRLDQSFWLDEAAQALESTRPFSEQLQLNSDFQPPLYHLLVHFLTYFSHAEWWLRLTSLIPGMLTIWFTLKLCQLLFNRFSASMAGLMLTTSQFHLYYSQELRPYSLAAMFAVWSMYELTLFLKKKRHSLIPLTLINAAGLYTMYLYPLLILSQLIIIANYYRQLLKTIILSFLFTILLFLPWFPSFIGQLQTGTGLLTSLPGWGTSVSPNLLKMLPLTLIKLSYGRINIDPVLKDVTLLLFLGLSIFWALRQKPNQKSHALLIYWFILPIIFAFLISLRIPILDPKRVLFVIPAFYILVSGGLFRNYKSLIALMVIISINLLNISRYFSEPLEGREPWKQLIISLKPLASPDTIYFFAFPEPFAPWRWYADPSIPTLAFVPKDLSDSDIFKRLSPYSSRTSIITFDYLMDLTDPDRRFYAYLKSKGYQETVIREAYLIGFVRLFSQPDVFAKLPI